MSTIVELKNAFEEIGKTGVRIEKEEIILHHHLRNPLFTETLQFVFNPYIVTGLAKKKIEKKVPVAKTSPEKLEDMFQYIQENKSGSDEIIGVVQHFINHSPTETQQFLKDVFTKDVQIGISLKTINKVLGENFIPEYGVQLAKNYFDEEHKVVGRFVLTLKVDGLRCTVFNEETGPKFFSRKGLPFEGLIELEELFRQMPKGIVYDGELLAENPDNLHSKDIFRKTGKIVKKDGFKKGVQFIAFDMLPISEFYSGKSLLGYEDRLIELEVARESAGLTENSLIQQVPCYYIGEDKEQVIEILDVVKKEGHEGLMLGLANAKYQTKRNDGLLKVKVFKDADLRIIGYEEYKHPNNLGALIVDYKGYRVNVGSGFSATQRAEYWVNREQLIGKIVKVKYFEESENQNGGISLRFPIFLEIRDDKDEPSYN